jgi:cytochrome c oxidase subunit 3
VSTPAILEPPSPDIGSGAPPFAGPPDDRGRGSGGGGGGGSHRPSGGGPGSVAVTGMWVALAPILMLFMAFTSAYIVRHGLGQDWAQVPVPRLLWLNTVVLLASSLSLERGRASLRTCGRARGWVLLTLALGISFVAGQLMAWQDFAGRGIHISTTPYSSFFYVLTGAHGVHLVGGILGLTAAASWPERGWRGTPHALVLRLAAIYWHFMAVLWLGLFALLNFWR